jgi:hypothetical protein
MIDTASTPETGSAGEVTPEDTINVDAVIADAIEQHYEDDTPAAPERDDKGRFVASNPPDEGEAPIEGEGAPDVAPPAEASGAEGQTEKEADSTEESPLEPPQHWPEADKTRFAEMPHNAQEWALERDKAMTADYTRKTQDVAEIRQRYQGFEQVLEPIRGALQQSGISDAAYMARLVDADKMYQTNPVEAIRWLASHAGVDLANLEPGDSEPTDPQIAALQNQVTRLTNHLSEQEQRSTAGRVNDISGQIDAFSKKADADGNPKYPHFESVRYAMGSLIQTGQAKELEDAYDKAVRLDDDLFKQTLSAERKKSEAAETNRRNEAVEKAKKVQPRKSSRPSGGVTKSNNLDDLIGASIDAAGIV